MVVPVKIVLAPLPGVADVMEPSRVIGLVLQTFERAHADRVVVTDAGPSGGSSQPPGENGMKLVTLAIAGMPLARMGMFMTPPASGYTGRSSYSCAATPH